jgi:REP element-mobilizing transposase RayT
VAQLCQAGFWVVYAWALMGNHFHLLVRTGNRSLAKSMRKLLTGYVVNFNRRHKRYGHLFQNRYKSIVCEDDPYLLELTRYIHLNPVRAGIIKDMRGLCKYPWAGHSALMGRVERKWQDVDTVLGYFGRRKSVAIGRYEDFIREGISWGRRPELVGGGLIRSLGGWAQVVSLRRKGIKAAHDDRILGSGEFVEGLLSEADRQQRETLRFRGKVQDLGSLARRIGMREGVGEWELRSGVRRGKVSRARRLFCQVAVGRMGYPAAEVARFLGVTTSAVVRAAHSESHPEIEKYL